MNSLKGLGKSKIKNVSSNPNYKPEDEAAMMAYIDKYSKMDLGPAIRKKDKRREAEEKKWKQKGGAEAVVNRILPPTCRLEPGFSMRWSSKCDLPERTQLNNPVRPRHKKRC
jgi:hypothetical protein